MGGRDELAAHRIDAIRSAQRAEARRVKDILARDKADAAAERFRREAELEVKAGKSVMMADAVVPPTREQLATGEFRTHYPRQPDGSTRVVKTVRRVPRSQARKMFLWGVIDLGGLKDCEWYAELYELAGLDGHYTSTNYLKEIFDTPVGHTMFTEHNLANQETLRFIRRNIRSRHLRLLDQVVLYNLPLKRAVRVARAFHRDPKPAFAEAVDQLGDARQRLKAD